MARTLFFRIVLRKFSEILTANQFLVSTIFFTIMNISFFNLRFHLFWIIAKEVNQIFSLHCFHVLLWTHYGPFQCFSTYFCKLKEIRVLQPIFPDCLISCDYVYIDECMDNQVCKLFALTGERYSEHVDDSLGKIKQKQITIE